MTMINGISSLSSLRGLYQAGSARGVASDRPAASRDPAPSPLLDIVQLSALYRANMPSYAEPMRIMGSSPSSDQSDDVSNDSGQTSGDPDTVASDLVAGEGSRGRQPTGAAISRPASTATPSAAASSTGEGDEVADDAVGSNGAADESKAGDKAKGGADKAANGEELSEDEQKMVNELKARDQEVRQHEAAHQSAGAGYAGAASYSYQKGPDGKNYAIGGEVSIDTSDAGSPDATAAKMRIVRAAALAPANPSGQDLAVAATASQREMEAMRESREEKTQEAEEKRAELEKQTEEAQGDENAAGADGKNAASGEVEAEASGNVAANEQTDSQISPSSASYAAPASGSSGGDSEAAAVFSTSSPLSGRNRAAYGGGRSAARNLIDLVA